MHPERRLGRELERNRKRRDQAADAEDEERGRPVADIERRLVEAAGAALRGEAREAGVEGFRPAPRAEAAQGCLCRTRLGGGIGQWTSAPQPPQT
jgi:hypothetical protein